MDRAYMILDPFKKRVKFWDELKIPDTPNQAEVLFEVK